MQVLQPLFQFLQSGVAKANTHVILFLFKPVTGADDGSMVVIQAFIKCFGLQQQASF